MKFFFTFFFADERKRKKICEKVIKIVLVVRGYKKNLEVGTKHLPRHDRLVNGSVGIFLHDSPLAVLATIIIIASGPVAVR